MKTKYFLFLILLATFMAFLGLERRAIAESRLYGIDLNGDGKITMEEWQGNQRTFEEFDLNHDGILSGTELHPGMIRTIEVFSNHPSFDHCEYLSRKDDFGKTIEQRQCTTSVQENL